MWWWRKVRRADISKELRDRFEQYGEHALVMAITAPGSTLYAQGAEMVKLVQESRAQITAWLKERTDRTARREDRLETVEWAILIFAVAGVLTDGLAVIHEFWLRAN
jgi:hypothetical protein